MSYLTVVRDNKDGIHPTQHLTKTEKESAVFAEDLKYLIRTVRKREDL